jgi:hypothetical protein
MLALQFLDMLRDSLHTSHNIYQRLLRVRFQQTEQISWLRVIVRVASMIVPYLGSTYLFRRSTYRLSCVGPPKLLGS